MIGSRAETRHEDFHFRREQSLASRRAKWERTPPIEPLWRSWANGLILIVLMVGLFWGLDLVDYWVGQP